MVRTRILVALGMLLLCSVTTGCRVSSDLDTRGTVTTAAPLTQRPSAPASSAPLGAPTEKQVMRLLAEQRAGTGLRVPAHLRIGSPIRVFRLLSSAKGNDIRALVNTDQVLLLFPVDSLAGPEAEVYYQRSVQTGAIEVSVSDGGHDRWDEYRRCLDFLPAAPSDAVRGVVPSLFYVAAVEWTATGTVGAFWEAGLTGMRTEGSPEPPRVPVGEVFRDEELGRMIRKASGS